VWSKMSEEEAACVLEYRGRLEADDELRGRLELERYPDDELLRFLVDISPPFDIAEGVEAMRASVRARATLPLPISQSVLDEWSSHVRLDGVSRDGEPAMLVVVDLALQEAMLRGPDGFIHAVMGLCERVRYEIFNARGATESIQTVVQVERGFRLALNAIPVVATQRLMTTLQDIYPSYSSRILIVNLPSYLVWFVRFVKGLLCEVTANKIELVNDYETLLDFYDEDSLPSLYKERRGVAPTG